MNSEKSSYPLGIGGELEKNKETASLYQVDNKVEYVNPDIEAPFDLVEGSRTDLGLFLSPVPKEGESAYEVEKQKHHGRAGILGRAVIQDKEGRRYRDIDAKGLGFLSRLMSREVIFQYCGTPGILNYGSAVKDMGISEEMLKFGLRASRVLSIIRLNEVFDQEGNRISIAAAKEKGIINEADEPVIEIRLMGINARIQDLAIDVNNYSEDKHRHDLLLEDARIIVSQELGKKPEEFSLNEYSTWFARNLGKQVALMHRNGWVHNCLTDQNITLDGRIVDFDTAEHYSYSKDKPNVDGLVENINHSRDIERAVRSLRKFFERISQDIKQTETAGVKQLIEEFRKSYFEGLELPEKDQLEIERGLGGQIEWGASEN